MLIRYAILAALGAASEASVDALASEESTESGNAATPEAAGLLGGQVAERCSPAMHTASRSTCGHSGGGGEAADADGSGGGASRLAAAASTPRRERSSRTT